MKEPLSDEDTAKDVAATVLSVSGNDVLEAVLESADAVVAATVESAESELDRSVVLESVGVEPSTVVWTVVKRVVDS